MGRDTPALNGLGPGAGDPDGPIPIAEIIKRDDEARPASTTPTGISSNDGYEGPLAMAGDAEGAETVTKKRKTGVGSRGVANLTPEQLAKKRANDREAQRAIRERTKNQIEKLERRIQELENQKPYQELQVVVRAKESVENENAEIKRRLANIIGMLQPLVGSNNDPSGTALPQSYTESMAAQPLNTLAYHSVGLTGSTAPAGTGGRQPASQTPHPPPTPSWQGGEPNASSTQAQVNSLNALEEQARPLLEQQRHNHRHGLQLGQERLDLGFLLTPDQTIHKMPSGDNGAQDSGDYKFIPMKHDWASLNTQVPPSNAWESPSVQVALSGPNQHGHDSDGSSPGYSRRDTSSHHSHRGYSPSPVPSGIAPNPPHTADGHGPDEVFAPYVSSLRNCEPTCPLDFLLTGFISERLQRRVEGIQPDEITGPRYPSVSSLLNPDRGIHSHPLSKFFTDIIAKFPVVNLLHKKVALLWVMFIFMRWRIMPTKENYDRIPKWLLPVESQISLPHPIWFDHVPFPSMRDKLVRAHVQNPKKYAFNDFFLPFLITMDLSWPYEDTDALLQHPETNELMLNPVYETHIRNLDNWKLGKVFVDAYPELAATCNYSGGGGVGGGGGGDTSSQHSTTPGTR